MFFCDFDEFIPRQFFVSVLIFVVDCLQIFDAKMLQNFYQRNYSRSIWRRRGFILGHFHANLPSLQFQVIIGYFC